MAFTTCGGLRLKLYAATLADGASGLAAWAWLRFATPLFDSSWAPPAAGWSILYGVLVGLAGLVGDLCESLLKRDMGKKDSAALVPGSERYGDRGVRVTTDDPIVAYKAFLAGVRLAGLAA